MVIFSPFDSSFWEILYIDEGHGYREVKIYPTYCKRTSSNCVTRFRLIRLTRVRRMQPYWAFRGDDSIKVATSCLSILYHGAYQTACTEFLRRHCERPNIIRQDRWMLAVSCPNPRLSSESVAWDHMSFVGM
jgi:hypothetical protein